MADAQGLTALRRLAEAAVERNRRIGERLIAEIERRRARIRKEFYEIGICLQQLAAPKIHAALGSPWPRSHRGKGRGGCN